LHKDLFVRYSYVRIFKKGLKMNKVFLCIVFCVVNGVVAGGDDQKEASDDCKKAMRSCSVCSGAASVSGCGMYVGGALADSGLVSTVAVINIGSGVMCCGLLAALIGASCPLDEEYEKPVALSKVPVAMPMGYGSLPQAVLLENLSQTE